MAGALSSSGVNLSIFTSETHSAPSKFLPIELFVLETFAWLVPSNQLLFNIDDCLQSFRVKKTILAITNIFIKEENLVESSFFISNLIFE